MNKIIGLVMLFSFPLISFAAVSFNQTVVSNGSATVSGSTTGGATTVVTANDSEIINTSSGSWSDTRGYKPGNYTVNATASDGSTAQTTFSVTGGGADPMNFSCGGHGSCYSSVASGEVTLLNYGEKGCVFYHGCVQKNAVAKPTFKYLKYGEKFGVETCGFYQGCVAKL